jgi:hypothetical protein
MSQVIYLLHAGYNISTSCALRGSIYSGKAKKRRTNPLPFKPQLQREKDLFGPFKQLSPDPCELSSMCVPCRRHGSPTSHSATSKTPIAWMIRIEARERSTKEYNPPGLSLSLYRICTFNSCFHRPIYTNNFTCGALDCFAVFAFET